MPLPELKSARLLLNPRRLADIDAVVRMNGDPRVMRYIAPVGDTAMGHEAVAARSFNHIERGLGYWSVFAKEAPKAFIGYVGLIPDGDAVEDVQISYRFAAGHWGQGYAGEAAACLLDHGFATLGLPMIGITTHPLNAASLRLAERLGFETAPTDPRILIGDPPVPAARLWLRRGARSNLTRREA